LPYSEVLTAAARKAHAAHCAMASKYESGGNNYETR